MNQVQNPVIPYNAPIPGGMFPGRMVRIKGNIPTSSDKFAVNLLCVATGDIALHVSPHFHSQHVIRNSVQNRHWGHEEKHGGLPVRAGQLFDMLILCEPQTYKIAFNGLHFTEFHHRVPFNNVSNLAIDGCVLVSMISFEGGSIAPCAMGGVGGFAAPSAPFSPGMSPYPPAGVVHPGPGAAVPPHLPQPGMPIHAGYPSHPHASYPMQPGYPSLSGHPTQPGYPSQPGYHTHNSTNTMYPHSPTGHKKAGLLDKAGMAVAGALGASTLIGGHKYNKLGVLGGGGLGTALAGAALTGHLNPKKAMKKQAKAHKKALKYGLPIAGAGLGAYALHKGMHKIGHRRSSSSSSSSSSD